MVVLISGWSDTYSKSRGKDFCRCQLVIEYWYILTPSWEVFWINFSSAVISLCWSYCSVMTKLVFELEVKERWYQSERGTFRAFEVVTEGPHMSAFLFFFTLYTFFLGFFSLKWNLLQKWKGYSPENISVTLRFIWSDVVTWLCVSAERKQ